jgi:hypothetical protein
VGDDQSSGRPAPAGPDQEDVMDDLVQTAGQATPGPVTSRDATKRSGRHRTAVAAALLAGATLLLAGCAAGANPATALPDPAGFWLGLWHGIITPFTFVISLFTDDVNIYEIKNNGNWYDFGYVIGLSMAFGGGAKGGSAGRKRSRRYD